MEADVFKYAGAFAEWTVEVVSVDHGDGAVVRLERSDVTVFELCRFVSHVPPKVRLGFRRVNCTGGLRHRPQCACASADVVAV